jgi:hypothetical protein
MPNPYIDNQAECSDNGSSEEMENSSANSFVKRESETSSESEPSSESSAECDSSTESKLKSTALYRSLYSFLRNLYLLRETILILSFYKMFCTRFSSTNSSSTTCSVCGQR